MAAFDKMLSEWGRHHGFDMVEAEFDDGWPKLVRGRIGERTLEVRDGKDLADALEKLRARWPRPESWPPAWLVPREKAWTDYPWPFGRHRDYYDREAGVMARQYAFTFRENGGNSVVVRGFGNTKTSAERSARGKLRRDHKLDPTRYYTERVDFVRGAP